MRPSATVDFPTLPVLCVQAMKRLLPARCSIVGCSLIGCTLWFPWIEGYCFCRKRVAIRLFERLGLPQSGGCGVRVSGFPRRLSVPESKRDTPTGSSFEEIAHGPYAQFNSARSFEVLSDRSPRLPSAAK